MSAPTTEADLEEQLSRPDAGVFRALKRSPGDVLVLGAAGKMGPSVTRMLRRAVEEMGDGRRVIAVSRRGGSTSDGALEGPAIACDLADADAVRRLPDAPTVIFMAGQKFGTQSDPASTWAMNAAVPAVVAQRFAGARMVVFSTGNVYPLSPVAAGGSRETDPLGPIGEYANSCVARERIFTYYAARHGSPLSIIRLNYAIALRYGVLVDIALAVRSGTPVNLAMGHVNVIWQRDANALALASLAHAAVPPFVVNVTGEETISVRSVAERFGAIFGKTPAFTGEEGRDALLSNTERMRSTLGPAGTSLDWMMAAVAEWIARGGKLLGKPTHFDTRDGAF